MALDLTKEQRSKVISLIKNHVAEHGNCRIGWAMREVAGEQFEKSIHLKEKIANTITQTGKYRKEASAQVGDDWNIFIDPQYGQLQFSKWTSIIAILISLSALIVSIVALFAHH
jgi:hypothetical protein